MKLRIGQNNPYDLAIKRKPLRHHLKSMQSIPNLLQGLTDFTKQKFPPPPLTVLKGYEAQ
jgi:hypothetical protein